MFEQAIESGAKKQLALLKKTGIFDDVYLAGGTALALWLGHRISYDLDFFTATSFDRDRFLQKLTEIGFKLDQESWGTLSGRLQKTKFSLFVYEYPLIDETSKYQGVDVAGLRDLAAMKITAISSRGTKRDFVDLYYLKDKFSVEEMIGFYDKKFRKLDTSRTHLLKSLNYFKDAEGDPEPNMLKSDYSWKKVKDFFTQEAQKITGNLVQGDKK